MHAFAALHARCPHHVCTTICCFGCCSATPFGTRTVKTISGSKALHVAEIKQVNNCVICGERCRSLHCVVQHCHANYTAPLNQLQTANQLSEQSVALLCTQVALVGSPSTSYHKVHDAQHPSEQLMAETTVTWPRPLHELVQTPASTIQAIAKT